MPTHPYRSQAKDALARARLQLAAKELRYAALELRMAMEALTYDRAQAYAKEIPPQEMATWQPAKVMQTLLEIEPHADQSYSLSFGEEPFPGGPPEKMHSLGTETVFSLQKIKKHYNAVGSVLHMPTMQQIEKQPHEDMTKLQTRLELIADELGKSLASPVSNFTVGVFSSIECLRCAKPIRKRLPPDLEAVDAVCYSCSAPYRLSRVGEKVIWEPVAQDWTCQSDGCSQVFTIWRDMVKDGAAWECKICKKSYQFRIAIFPDDAIDTSTDQTGSS